MNSKEVLNLLEWTGAIMNGHFKLTSGRHSDTYIEKFRLLENPIALDKSCHLKPLITSAEAPNNIAPTTY